VADKIENRRQEPIGAWVKRCYLASRAVMDAALRPHDLGVTQWYVLYLLVHDGPTMQRELQRVLQVERATLSAVVVALVRKGFIEQVPDRADQRQKLLQITTEGRKLWDRLPDLSFIGKTAFGGIDEQAIAAAVSVLRTATERLEKLSREGTGA
jgi:DNA-binding MarR family transcriptional regulator